MTAKYCEIADYPSRWLINLIAADEVCPGEVDTRSIAALHPIDLLDHDQFHSFAGIGVWSLALRNAGWPDDVPVWTGSCPCQPFSSAGRKKGFDDERHLWPEWFRLIRQCRPPVIFGEQVASKDGLSWLDAVLSDLEGEGYAVAAFDLPAAGVGAPHLRQRIYFVAVCDDGPDGALRRLVVPRLRATCSMADDDDDGREGSELHVLKRGPLAPLPDAGGNGAGCGLAHTAEIGREEGRAGESGGRHEPERRRPLEPGGLRPARGIDALSVVDAGDEGGRRHAGGLPGAEGEGAGRGFNARDLADLSLSPSGLVLPAELLGADGVCRGFWADCDWVYCADPTGARWRPVEPGTFPLAHGAAARVGRVGAAGNAIAEPLAREVVRAAIGAILENYS